MTQTTAPIQRHKTAIRRVSFSLPIKCVLRDGLLDPSRTLFDYGCGRGQDLTLLGGLGINADGWDPAHRPDTERRPADVVNLGYVINVVEDQQERTEALRTAWELAGNLLVVAAQVDLAAPEGERQRFGDGILTSRGTFQKYYRQQELRAYLEEALATDAVPAAPGIFYLFKDETAKEEYLVNRYRRSTVVPRLRISELLYEQNQDVLAPFLTCLTRLGRMPAREELSEAFEITQRFGSLKRAFALVRRVTADEPWTRIATRRAEDLLVYLALARFGKRAHFSKLPQTTQLDVKAFYGTYTAACETADRLLFAAGKAETIDQACQRAPVGLLVENALLVHRSALEHLPPILRIYEGCARALLGEVDEANVIKLHRFSGKVSYLAYPDFERDPHPALVRRIKVSLRTLWIEDFDYTGWDDPPILSRKDALISSDHPLRERFARLTKQEDRRELLEGQPMGLSRSLLEARFGSAGLILRGHRLCASGRIGSEDRAGTQSTGQPAVTP